ncbi:uncharacterized protein CLUP02_04849 [Colletotrichum lupini]|uniref:Uncharacterized protein n=1 Tax=Colletotrichum lupini TaxID=145971 RepID=A0A9Q8WE61_9PEZI|nr:uncharacterized protein CLUP02_04849 [Colletotrichum lupini]UQC79370.1 hypothetical protein CLUP02_04849 [Colletotrichum lupini]
MSSTPARCLDAKSGPADLDSGIPFHQKYKIASFSEEGKLWPVIWQEAEYNQSLFCTQLGHHCWLSRRISLWLDDYTIWVAACDTEIPPQCHRAWMPVVGACGFIRCRWPSFLLRCPLQICLGSKERAWRSLNLVTENKTSYNPRTWYYVFYGFCDMTSKISAPALPLSQATNKL